MENEAALIPRLARIKFALQPSKAAAQSPEYAQLAQDTEALVINCQISLKVQILKMTKLECTTSAKQLVTDFITALRLIVQTYVIIDEDLPRNDIDRIALSAVSISPDDIYAFFMTNEDEFRDAYRRTHGTQVLPQGFADADLFQGQPEEPPALIAQPVQVTPGQQQRQNVNHQI